MSDSERTTSTLPGTRAESSPLPAASSSLSEPRPQDASRPQSAGPDETELFAGGPSPHYFGEGSYSSGGPIAEGKYALPDPNPRGGYGSFTDAGGYGATTLLGEEQATHGARTEEDEPRK